MKPVFLTGLLAMFTTCTCAAIPPVATPFALSEVRLLESPFKQAMDRNAGYLLSLEPDRFLHNTRLYAGLKPKGEIYGGWESQGIAGHSLGHYLTALSLHFAATGDARFRERIDYLIAELDECQQAYGDGYVGALPPKELAVMRAFKDGVVEPASPFNFKGGAWVPWYTQHKILAGLKDAWVLGGSPRAKVVALRLADWTDALTAGLTSAQQQAMLHVEHGGMIETLVDLHALTGNPRYLEVSRRFYHHAIFDPLVAGRDELNGRHANTQIPKIIGEARHYEVTGNPEARRLSEFFWDTVVKHRSWAIGGNSDREHFFPVGHAHEHLGPQTAETCNTYNMLKLTGHLHAWSPRVEFADYYERALYNHILASQEPRQGMFAYFVSLKSGHFKTYSTPADSFWCCVGSGMENHTKYGEAIYHHAGDALFINLFIPSELTWRDQGLRLTQHTAYPREKTTRFTIDSAPSAPLALRIRCPAWAAGPLVVELNGQPLAVASRPGDYTEIRRIWKASDHLRVTVPMGLRIESLENNADKIAFLYGPLVLAGDLGPAPETASFPYAKNQAENDRVPVASVPTLIRSTGLDLLSALQPVAGDLLAFRFTSGVARPVGVTLRPFNTLFYERYTVYWDVLSPEAWQSREADAAQRARDEARVIDELRLGEQQSEIDHAVVSDRSQIGDFRDRKWRDARDGGWFEFRLKIRRDTPQVLRCTYWGGDDGKRTFDLLLDGQPLATQTLARNRPGQFFDVDYPLPPDLLAGKDHVVIRLQSRADHLAGGLFRAAMLEAASVK